VGENEWSTLRNFAGAIGCSFCLKPHQRRLGVFSPLPPMDTRDGKSGGNVSGMGVVCGLRRLSTLFVLSIIVVHKLLQSQHATVSLLIHSRCKILMPTLMLRGRGALMTQRLLVLIPKQKNNTHHPLMKNQTEMTMRRPGRPLILTRQTMPLVVQLIWSPLLCWWGPLTPIPAP